MLSILDEKSLISSAGATEKSLLSCVLNKTALKIGW